MADTATGDGKPTRWAVWVVLLMCLTVYLPSVRNGFAMDDDPIAKSTYSRQPTQPDPIIQAHLAHGGLDYFGEFFRHYYWEYESLNDGLYRPISVMSYALVYRFVAQPFLSPANEAAPQHVVNVLLYVWAVYLVVQLLVSVGAPGFLALFVALLFGSNAIHTEVIAGIVGRAELFSFCFGIQALLLMAKTGWWRYLLASVLLFLAYCSKESSLCWIPFWFCFALARQWQRSPNGDPWLPFKGKQVLTSIAVLLIPCIGFFVLRGMVMAQTPPVAFAAEYSSNPLAWVGAGERIMTGIKLWGYGFWLCLAPFKLSSIYSPRVFEHVVSPLDLGFILSLCVLGLLLYGGLRYGRRHPLLFLAMTLFLGFSSITSNVPLAVGTIFGERLYFVPSLGTCLLVVAAWPLLRGRGRIVFLGLASVWVAANLAMVAKRVPQWRDSAVLYLADVQTYPQSIDLHRKNAAVYQGQGERYDPDKAIWHLLRAVAIQPNFVLAYRQLGRLYANQGRFEDAIVQFKSALESTDYPQLPGSQYHEWNDWGNALIELSRRAADPDVKRRHIQDAIEKYKASLDLDPITDSHGASRNLLGDGFLALSELEEDADAGEKHVAMALSHFRATVEQNGPSPSKEKAFKRIFRHAVGPIGPVFPAEFPKNRLVDYYREARQAYAGDWELRLEMGITAHVLEMLPQDVRGALSVIAPPAVDPALHDDRYYTAMGYLYDALVEDDRNSVGIRNWLLGNESVPESIKERIRNK